MDAKDQVRTQDQEPRAKDQPHDLFDYYTNTKNAPAGRVQWPASPPSGLAKSDKELDLVVFVLAHTGDNEADVCVASVERVQRVIDVVLEVAHHVTADRFSRYPDGNLIAGVAGARRRAEPAPEIFFVHFGADKRQ